MRWPWAVPILLLTGLGFCASPILNVHRSLSEIDTEISNMFDNLQSRQYRVMNATPTLTALQDGEVIIVSSNTTTRIMYRSGQEIFSVLGSCVTVTR